MKKGLLVLIGLLLCVTAVYAAEGPAGAMAGETATVGEYLNLAGLDTKVINWGFVQVPDKAVLGASGYFGSTKNFAKTGERVLRIDLLYKNATKKPIKLYTGYVTGTIISKDERSFNLKAHGLKKYGVTKGFSETILPGQPVKGTCYIRVEKDIIPAKFVLRNSKVPDRAIRFFLQQNLPEEVIPGTIHALTIKKTVKPAAAVDEADETTIAPESETPAAETTTATVAKPKEIAAEEEEKEEVAAGSVGDALKKEAEAAADKEAKRQVKKKTQKEIKKLFKF
ncbi:MAG: hypothetical protein ABH823_01205 [bacterium]